nr:MAG TPA: hypothetical protein [Caudoviricetes sp.]
MRELPYVLPLLSSNLIGTTSFKNNSCVHL